MIEQVQHTGTDTVTKSATKQVRLSYNHPVKELVWCVAEGDSEGAQTMWNLVQDATRMLIVSCSRLPLRTRLSAANQLGCPSFDAAADWCDIGSLKKSGNLDTFKLVLNGQDRFKEQSGKYFNQVQPYQHHSGSPYAGVYSYSFALKPEEHQPTGTCNFSRIDNAQVAVKCSTSVVRPPRTSTCSRLTTTFSVCNPVWAVSRSPTKRLKRLKI